MWNKLAYIFGSGLVGGAFLVVVLFVVSVVLAAMLKVGNNILAAWGF